MLSAGAIKNPRTSGWLEVGEPLHTNVDGGKGGRSQQPPKTYPFGPGQASMNDMAKLLDSMGDLPLYLIPPLDCNF